MTDATRPSAAPLVSPHAGARRITIVGAWVDFALGLGKLIGGSYAHSQALIADGLHSLSDLATDLLVLYAVTHARADADAEHPYGHERIETVATVALGAVLILVGAGIAVDAGYDLFHPEGLMVPAAWAIAIALLSVLSKEGLYRYTLRCARRTRSNLLRANAWHHRSDALSSVVVIIGVGGTLMGLEYLDAIAAFVVAGMVAKIGFDLARSSVAELIDTALDPAQVEDIRAAIMSVSGVRDLHMLRTRHMGGKALVDVHILLHDPRLSVSEGHQISETVRAHLIRRIDDVEDVTVHIDHEDDEVMAPGKDLALRDEVMARLDVRWSGIAAARQMRRVTLHYLDGRIHAEVELPLALVDGEAQAAALVRAFNDAVSEDADIAEVHLLYS